MQKRRKKDELTYEHSISISVVITPANTHDIKAAKYAIDSVIVRRPLKKQNICLDKGYDYPEIEIEIESIKRRYISPRHRRGENKELIKQNNIILKEDGL